MRAATTPLGTPWLWTLDLGHHENHTPAHGYEATRGRDGGIRQELAAEMKHLDTHGQSGDATPSKPFASGSLPRWHPVGQHRGGNADLLAGESFK
jgi:hypothetical protein